MTAKGTDKSHLPDADANKPGDHFYFWRIYKKMACELGEKIWPRALPSFCCTKEAWGFSCSLFALLLNFFNVNCSPKETTWTTN